LFLALLGVSISGEGAAPPKQGVIPPLVDEKALMALDEATLSGMSLDDPMLRVAYAQIFLREADGKTANWERATRADLRRRGNTVTPSLLSLFEENPEGQFRANLMFRIETYANSLYLEPFLSAARSLFQREGLNMPPRTCYGMAWLFERHGTPEDLEILKQLRNHPINRSRP
jgi:hypothetical protein